MATVVRGSILIALVGVLVSGAVALAVSETRINELDRDVQDCEATSEVITEEMQQNREAINDIECTLSGMSTDVDWIVVTLRDIKDGMERAQ